jgi:hypothetical protein
MNGEGQNIIGTAEEGLPDDEGRARRESEVQAAAPVEPAAGRDARAARLRRRAR